jgi:predicted lipid-binding transport protein (Tim44 family)
METSMSPLRSKIAAALGVTLAAGLLVAEPADARRGGSFGSRGSRTYSAPARTMTSPGYVPPVQRSMTAPGSSYNGGYAPRPGSPGYAYGSANGARPGMFNSGGFGRGMIGGLVAGGLIGGLLGHGFGGGWGGYGGGYGGGGAGLLGGLLQLLVLFFVGSMVWRWFRNRNASQAFTSPFAQGPGPTGANDAYDSARFNGGGFNNGYGDGGYGGATAVPPTSAPGWQIPITGQDQADFESLLKTLQDAFGREDYGRLRDITTPEVMSYLAEELSENATHGRRNEVNGTRLIKADVGEAWNEGGVDYATAAMRYESIDIMRDRATGAVLSGDPATPTQTTELWTFARHRGQPWKLAAIQETGA